VLLLTGLVLLTMQLCAQLPDYHLQLFDYSSGIRPGSISATAKDKNGFLWVLYPRSVQRFDGRHTKTFTMQGALQHLFCDEKGSVWIVTPERVYRFENDHIGFREVPLHTDSTVGLGAPFALPDGTLLLFTSRGLYQYSEAAQHFAAVRRPLPVPPPYDVRPFARIGSSIFFRKDNRIHRCNLQTNHVASLPDTASYSLSPLSADSLLVSNWNN
jgi:hypothetical protein